MKAISSAKSYRNGNNSVYLLANIQNYSICYCFEVKKIAKVFKVALKAMVNACVYRGHFPCLGYGCLAIPLDRKECPRFRVVYL